MRFSLTAIAVFGLCLGSEVDSSERSKSSSTSAVVVIPKEFPIGLTTVVAGKLEGQGPSGNSFQLTGAALQKEPIVAQLDAKTGDLLFFTTIRDASLRDKAHKLKATKGLDKAIVSIKEVEGGFQFVDDGRPVMFYQKDPKSQDGRFTRTNYIHPLRGLDGAVLTQDFPSDHRHHRGVFWAWHQLLIGDKRVGDSWAASKFLSVVKQAKIVDQGPLFATLQVTVDWTSPLFTDDKGQPKPFVEEISTIRLFHATAETQYVDFKIAIKPLFDDFKIGGSENVKGYSGFTVRIKPPREINIIDQQGARTKDAVGTKSAWADVSGKYGHGDAVTGIGILCHKSLPEFPPRWLLRHYGMQNVAYPGRHAVAVPKDKPLVLRHRLVLHRGDAKQARIPEHQKIYEGSGTGASH